MPIIYNYKHSIEIKLGGDLKAYNTWADWHLVPAARPFIAIPEPNIVTAQILGTDDYFDFTDIIPGGLSYGNCIGEWEFYIDHELWGNWINAYEGLSSLLNGRPAAVRLVDEPTIRYYGILEVSSYTPNQDYSTIRIKYSLDSDYEVTDDEIYDPSGNQSEGHDDDPYWEPETTGPLIGQGSAGSKSGWSSTGTWYNPKINESTGYGKYNIRQIAYSKSSIRLNKGESVSLVCRCSGKAHSFIFRWYPLSGSGYQDEFITIDNPIPNKNYRITFAYNQQTIERENTMILGCYFGFLYNINNSPSEDEYKSFTSFSIRKDTE